MDNISMDIISPESLTDKDYQRAQIIIDTVRAFDQSSYQSVFVMDTFRNDFLYLSERSFFYGNRPVEEIKAEGYEFFLSNAPKEDAMRMNEILVATRTFISEIPAEERTRCFVSFDFHFLKGKKKLLVNHKLTPLALDASGRVWLTLCVSTFSVIKQEMGNTLFGHLSAKKFYHYSIAEHRWIEHFELCLKPIEKNVLVLSARGYSVIEIAKMIYKSEDTVKLYRKQLFKKLNVNNITEALAVAINYGLL